ncbi:MAG: hypothetical protein QGG53_43250 [Planctomycetota bacterium]|nr:hypothetical protein [Planctomycetota bacterium]
MKALARKLEILWDSPNLLKDIGSLLSAWRIGAWFCLINMVLGPLMATMIVMGSIENEEPFVQISQQLGLGQYLAVNLMLGLCGVLTLLIPLRASGLIEGPRWAKYFDQIVLSGISPERYLAGRIASQNIFFVLILLASMPYAVFGLSLGGTKFSYIVGCLFALWVYANLLSVATVAAGAIVHETGAVFLTVTLAGVMFGLGLIPVAVFGLSPTHYIIEPFHQALASAGKLSTGYQFVINYRGATYQLSSLLLFAFNGGLLGLVCFLFCLLGPVNCLVKENSTFGEVVMPGDTKRKRLFRMRFILRRRSEVAFFYENRNPLLTRWEVPLRYLPICAILGTTILLAFGVAHYYSYELDLEDFSGLNLFLMCAGLVAAAFTFTADRMTETTEMRCGRFTFTKGALDATAFLFFAALVYAIGFWGINMREAFELSEQRSLGQAETAWSWLRSPPDVREVAYVKKVTKLCHFFFLLGLEIYALIRLMGCQFWERSTSVFVMLIFLLALFGVPLGGTLVFFSHRDLRHLAQSVAFISVPSPIPLIVATVDDYVGGEMGRLLDTGWYRVTPVFHSLLVLTLAGWTVFCHRTLKRARSKSAEEKS